MNKLTLTLTILATALIVFIVTATSINTTYQGYNAQYWYNQSQNSETLRNADYGAITCVRGLGYTNLPSLDSYYTNLGTLDSTDPTFTYYSKNQVDTCLYGL